MDINTPDFVVTALCRFSKVNFNDHINNKTVSPDLVDIDIKINSVTMRVTCIVTKQQCFVGSMLEKHYDINQESFIEFKSFNIIDHNFIKSDDVVPGSEIVSEKRLADAHFAGYYKFHPVKYSNV